MLFVAISKTELEENTQFVENYVFHDLYYYTGELRDAKLHGVGKISLIHEDPNDFESDSNLFHCSFADLYNLHSPSGYLLNGKIHKPVSCSSYEGEFFENEIHGNGVMQWTDGTLKTGQWSHNKLNGAATIYLSDGDIYHGNVLNDL